MSDEHNIEDQSRDDSPQSIENAHPDDLVGRENISELQTINYQPQTNMEAHHPHHVTHKKKWTEYLLEFFMLFLAVFLGFVAENVREHMVEKNREHDYVKSLIEDLQTDTAILRNQLPLMKQSVKGLDTLIQATYLYIQGKGDTRVMYYTYHHYCRNVFNLQLSERTVNQLKNSGNMRLIHDKQAANIISGAEVGFESLRDQTRFYKTRQEDPSNFGLKIFDFREYQKANTNADGTTDFSESGFLKLSYQPALNFTDTVYLKEFAARVGYYRNSFNVYVQQLEATIPLLEQAMNQLRQDYKMN